MVSIKELRKQEASLSKDELVIVKMTEKYYKVIEKLNKEVAFYLIKDGKVTFISKEVSSKLNKK